MRRRQSRNWGPSAPIGSPPASCPLSLGDGAADPLRQQPFLARGGRQTRMQRTAVRRAGRLDIAKEQRAALGAAVTPVQQGKFRLRALERVVQVDQEGGDALALG